MQNTIVEKAKTYSTNLVIARSKKQATTQGKSPALNKKLIQQPIIAKSIKCAQKTA